jgi:hypothetical protein
VKQHLKRIFGKLDVHSRTELVAIAGTFAPDEERGEVAASASSAGRREPSLDRMSARSRPRR